MNTIKGNTTGGKAPGKTLDRLLRLKAIAADLDVHAQTVKRMAVRGDYPPFITINGRLHQSETAHEEFKHGLFRRAREGGKP